MASKLFISAKEVAKELEVSDSYAYRLIRQLINMGYSAVAIGERVGHESVEITYRYAHLFPTIQTEMAENLNQEREEYLDE